MKNAKDNANRFIIHLWTFTYQNWLQYLSIFTNHNVFLRQTDKIYTTKYKSHTPAVTKQPHSHSMPLLSFTGNGGQTNRNASTPKRVEDVESQKPSSGGCHCICCDHFCSCASTNVSSPTANCCYLWKTNYMPFIIKLLLVALVAILIIEFLYRKVMTVVDDTIAEVRKIDVTTTTKLVKR